MEEDAYHSDRRVAKKCSNCTSVRNCKSLDQASCTSRIFLSAKQLDCIMRRGVDEEKGIMHVHGSNAQKDLTQEELVKVDKMIKKNPSITTITGIVNSRIFDSEEDIENINPILLNKNRMKHEIRKSQIRSGLSNPLGKDPFEEFAKIEEEFPDDVISA